MKRLAVFASGKGSNLQAIIDAVEKKKIKTEIGLVLSDNPAAYALKRAKRAKIKTVCLEAQLFPDRETYDREVIRYLKEAKIDFVILAGFMRILSAHFVRHYRGRLINIHPSLLPAFKGAHAVRDAFEYGVKVIGVTVHFVDEKVDHGPIILQEVLPVYPQDTLKSLERRVHQLEHRTYPKAVDLLVRGRLKFNGRTVIVR